MKTKNKKFVQAKYQVNLYDPRDGEVYYNNVGYLHLYGGKRRINPRKRLITTGFIFKSIYDAFKGGPYEIFGDVKILAVEWIDRRGNKWGKDFESFLHPEPVPEWW